MKKIILSLMLMLSIVLGTNAQVANTHEFAQSGNKLLDNTYVGISFGATTPLNQTYSINSVFPVNPVGTVKIGKNFTPVFGMDIEGSMWTGTFKKFDRATNIGLNTTVNLSNLFFGYKENKPRIFEVSTVAGFGYLYFNYENENAVHNVNFNKNMSDGRNFMSVKTGLDLAFNLGKSYANQIVLSPEILWNMTREGKVQFNSKYAQLGISVGYVYKFKTSNKTHNFKYYDITDMNDNINSLQKEVQDLKNRKPEVVEKLVEKEVYTDKVNYVFFAKNSTELTQEAKEVLDKIKGNVDITATSSPEGTYKYNKELSDKRAQTVADYLSKISGVTVKSFKGLGVTGNSSNRVAIITEE